MDCNTANNYRYHHHPTSSASSSTTMTSATAAFSSISECHEKDVPNAIHQHHQFQNYYREFGATDNRLSDLNRFKYTFYPFVDAGVQVSNANYEAAKSFQGYYSPGEQTERNFVEHSLANGVESRNEDLVMVMNDNRVTAVDAPRDETRCSNSFGDDAIMNNDIMQKGCKGAKYEMEANFYMCSDSNEGQEEAEGSFGETEIGKKWDSLCET